MGASGKWIRTLVGFRPAAERERPGAAGKGRKWSRLWRSSSSHWGSSAPPWEAPSEASSTADALSSSVVAAVVRAQPRDFRVIRQEWAAVRIQLPSAHSWALRALRGIVRLQALLRGRRVRKQLAVTLKCTNALVRVQERARDRRFRISADGRHSQGILDDRSGRADPVKEAELVSITIREFGDGTRELRRVRFSRERFGEDRAKVWWEQNRDRIHAQYL